MQLKLSRLEMDFQKKFEQLKRLVGNTPLIKINYCYKGEVKYAYIKAEWYNLSGSIKDRVAYYILKNAYETGTINEKTPICEVTSGNMGISIAAISRYLGNPCTICIPKFMSKERFKLLKLYGAHLELTEDFESAFKKAEEYKKQGYYLTYQFENEYNMIAHYETTAPEIEAKINEFPCFIAGVGTAGTLHGCGKYFKDKHNAKMFALEPLQSSILTLGKSLGPHKIQGLSDEIIPGLYPEKLVDDIIRVDDNDAIGMAQRLCKELSLGVGISGGANFLGCVLSGYNGAISVFADDNKKYLSTALADESIHSQLVDEIDLLGFEVL